MQPTRLLQIVLPLLMAGQAEATPLACLKPDEIQSENYKLQSHQGYYDGAIADGAIVLRIYLDVTREREVFALTGKFKVERDGQQQSSFASEENRSGTIWATISWGARFGTTGRFALSVPRWIFLSRREWG